MFDNITETLTFPAFLKVFFKVSDFTFGHKCEENKEKQQFTPCSEISKGGKSVKCEIFQKTGLFWQE
jgi:hypothetical protein